MTSPTFWNQVFVWPILNVLIFFYKLFEAVHIPGPLGFAIILLTVAIRILLYPLMKTQLSSARKMQQLKPHLDVIQAKHKGDKQKIQQAQLELYKQHGVNPAAGCLPLIVQMTVLIALYNVFFQVLNNGNIEVLVGQINQILYMPWLKLTTFDLTFLGVNLGIKPGQWQTVGWWVLAVPLVTGLLQWWQTKLMMVSAPKPQATSDKKQEIGKKEEEKPGDTAGEMQKQMAMITPVMFGIFAFQFPLGLSLYWNVFGLFGIMQQIQINKSN